MIRSRVSDLCKAAAAGNTAKVQKILDAQPDLVNVHVSEGDEHQALHFAVLHQQPETARILMKAGANHQQGIYPHRDATSPLTIAEERGYTDLVEIIRSEDEVRKLAACSNITISPENDSLFEAVRSGNDQEALDILDEHPDLLDACHRNGGSVIHAAASHGRPNLTTKLLAKGADIDHLTPEGQSPLDGAILNSNPADRDGHERRMICAGIMMAVGAKLSIEAAVALGDVKTVRDIKSEDPEQFENVVNSRLDSGQPGLLALAVKFNRLKMLNLLLSFGLDPDEKYRISEYENEVYSWGLPLCNAAGESQYEFAEALLDAGADPNGRVYACGDPVGNAYTNRDDKMKSLLFSHGGRIDITTAALECDTSACAMALSLDPGKAKKIFWASACGGNPDVVSMCLKLLDWPLDDKRWFSMLEQPLRIWQYDGHRKFHDHDREKFPQCLALMLDHGISANIVGRFGYRILHHLIPAGVCWGVPVMTEEERVRFGELFLEHGAELNVIDDLLQSTPLGWAARWGKTKIVELFLKHGADKSLAGEPWATPLAWAEKKGHTDIIELLKRDNASSNDNKHRDTDLMSD